MSLNFQIFRTTALIFCLLSLLSTPAIAVDQGPLDQPLPTAGNRQPGKPGAVGLQNQNTQTTLSPEAAQAQLRDEVAEEQKELEKLDREQLKAKAENGERGAQVVLGADYAKEATLLSFAPIAANDALSDAAKWYSLAASRGYPGAPSLDQAGVKFYPIRVQRPLRQ